MASVGGDSNAGDNDGPGTSGMGDGGEPGHDSGLGDRGGYGRNTQGSDGGPYGQNDRYNQTPKAPDQYLADEDPVFRAMQMGGTNRSASYQTQMPNYTDLKSKHTAGVQDPVTNDRTHPSMFNFNGTVYKYEPEGDAYRDTYTGQLITADNGVLGSQGIASLYNNYVPNELSQQYVSTDLYPTAPIDYTNEKRINPEYEAYMAKYGGGGAKEAPATKPDNMNSTAYNTWKTTGVEPPPRSRGGGRYDPKWGYWVD